MLLALSSMALVTTEEALTFLQLPNVKPTDKEYTIVEAFVNGASGALDKRAGPIIQRSFTEIHDGTRKEELFLRNYPIVSVESVEVDEMVWTLEDFGWYDYGVLYVRDGFYRAFRIRYFADDYRQNVKIRYTAGMAATKEAVPEDLRQACLLLVSYWYRREVEVVGSTYTEMPPDVRFTDFPREVKFLIAPYERRNRAGGA